MVQRKKAFRDGLTLVSLWGFLVIALSSFDIINLAEWQTSVLMIIIGGTLMLEGQILTVKRWGFDGISGNEIPFLMTITIGLFSIIVGILALPFIDITNPQLQTFTGIVSFVAFGFIALERWVFK